MSRLTSKQCSLRTMTHLSLVFGLVASGALSLAVATDFWLYTTEVVDPFALGSPPGMDVNETKDVAVERHDEEKEEEDGKEDKEGEETVSCAGPLSAITARMHSGLWRSCTYYIAEDFCGETLPFPMCTNIAYFGQDHDRPEQAQTTTSIFRAIQKSAPVIVGSLLITVTALALSILGNNKRDVRTLVAAILFICAALSLAIGVIFYISAVNDEVSHRKKSITAESEGFHYSYGWAVFFAGSSFMCSMAAAVNNISLYLRRGCPHAAEELASSADKPQALLPNRNAKITTPV